MSDHKTRQRWEARRKAIADEFFAGDEAHAETVLDALPYSAVPDWDDVALLMQSMGAAGLLATPARDAEVVALRERDDPRAEVERLARAAYAVDRLREVADGRVQHRYEGECPSATEDHASRDLDCPACAALILAATWRIDPTEGETDGN